MAGQTNNLRQNERPNYGQTRGLGSQYPIVTPPDIGSKTNEPLNKPRELGDLNRPNETKETGRGIGDMADEHLNLATSPEYLLGGGRIVYVMKGGKWEPETDKYGDPVLFYPPGQEPTQVTTKPREDYLAQAIDQIIKDLEKYIINFFKKAGNLLKLKSGGQKLTSLTGIINSLYKKK